MLYVCMKCCDYCGCGMRPCASADTKTAASATKLSSVQVCGAAYTFSKGLDACIKFEVLGCRFQATAPAA